MLSILGVCFLVAYIRSTIAEDTKRCAKGAVVCFAFSPVEGILRASVTIASAISAVFLILVLWFALVALQKWGQKKIPAKEFQKYAGEAKGILLFAPEDAAFSNIEIEKHVFLWSGDIQAYHYPASFQLIAYAKESLPLCAEDIYLTQSYGTLRKASSLFWATRKKEG